MSATLRLTVKEYERLKASLPRGPFGPIWPTALLCAVFIVEEPPVDIPRAFVVAAKAYAASRRN
jgi:hypothetical protein